MDNNIEFPQGIFAKAPHQNAPDFVKGKVSIKLDEAIAYLQSKAAQGEEWLTLDIKESRAGKWYASVDTWQPQGGNAPTQTAQTAQTAPVPAFEEGPEPTPMQSGPYPDEGEDIPF